jgi:hypothetical protein
MQSHLCIGGNHDGLNYPAHADAETIQLAVGDHEMKPSHSSRNATIGSTFVARRAGR